MRSRIMALISALAVVVAGGAVFLTLPGSAALAAVDDPALAGQRVWCIDANGSPHYLPSPCKQYPGMWYFGNGANLYVGQGPVVSAPVAPVVTAAPVVSGNGSAPALSLNATPSETSVPLKWSPGAPPTDDTIVGYQIHFRKTSVASWTNASSPGNVLAVTVGSLQAGTMYYFQIRAVYNTTGGYGPWSNTVTVTTEAGDAEASSTVTSTSS